MISKCFEMFKFSTLPNVDIILGKKPLDMQLNVIYAKENRFAITKEYELDSIFEAKQIHTDNLIFIENWNFATMPEADGLATNRINQALLIKTADCQAIFFVHKTQKYIMAIHVGWRGNKINFIQSAVNKFCAQYNLFACDLYALRSASLSQKYARFTDFTNEWGEEFLDFYNPITKTMNLWELSNYQMQNAGLLKENIFTIDECTYEKSDKYYSYRRDKDNLRQASLIWIKE